MRCENIISTELLRCGYEGYNEKTHQKESVFVVLLRDERLSSWKLIEFPGKRPLNVSMKSFLKTEMLIADSGQHPS